MEAVSLSVVCREHIFLLPNSVCPVPGRSKTFASLTKESLLIHIIFLGGIYRRAISSKRVLKLSVPKTGGTWSWAFAAPAINSAIAVIAILIFILLFLIATTFIQFKIIDVWCPSKAASHTDNIVSR